MCVLNKIIVLKLGTFLIQSQSKINFPFNELLIHSMKFMFHLHVKDIDCFMLIHPINLILHNPFWWPEEILVMPTQRYYFNRSS